MKVANQISKRNIGWAIEYYHKYEAVCDTLSKRANEMIELSQLRDELEGDITCEYQNGLGLVFVVELKDGEAPHTIPCSSFFELFEDDLDEITIRDLKMLSL